MVAGEDAVLAVDDGRYHVAFLVYVGHALLVYDGLGGSGQVVPYGIKVLFYLCCFLKGNRGSGIALDAALPVALGQVAAELLRQYVGRNKCVLNL